MQIQLIKGLMINWNKIDRDSYLRDIDVLRHLDHMYFNHSVTFFSGENGSGKSTLLEGIAVAAGFNPEGGTRNYHFSTYDSHSKLYNAITLMRSPRHNKNGYFFRAESFYNVATKEEEYSQSGGGEPMHYHEKSHGESFLKLVQYNFRPNGLYLLDEPEAALSPQRQLTLLAEIHRCVQEGSQFIIATHSPILLGLPGSEILSFDGDHIHPIAYEDTESYQITKLFLNNREGLLEKLFNEE